MRAGKRRGSSVISARSSGLANTSEKPWTVDAGFATTERSVQDLRYACRTFVRERGFTAVAILVLALAIAANIATFSVVNTLLLRPLPFPAAHELVWIAPPPAPCGLSCATYSADAYDEFRAGAGPTGT